MQSSQQLAENLTKNQDVSNFTLIIEIIKLHKILSQVNASKI